MNQKRDQLSGHPLGKSKKSRYTIVPAPLGVESNTIEHLYITLATCTPSRTLHVDKMRCTQPFPLKTGFKEIKWSTM